MQNVHIIDTETGEERVYLYDFPWTGEASEFIWDEGAYSSDGNRSLFFAWASGEAPDNDVVHDLDSERFMVWIADNTGAVLYDERDGPPLPHLPEEG